jgi:hypothetical protein
MDLNPSTALPDNDIDAVSRSIRNHFLYMFQSKSLSITSNLAKNPDK